jgi:sphingosine kinase
MERRHILVLVNPFGGRKKGVQIYETYVAPLFHLAGLQVTLKQTERAMHAFQIARDLDLGAYDAVVTVSGDGLFHEFINGLMSRPDAKEASRLPLGIIPAGSGNALAKSVDTILPDVAALNIIKGQTRPFDLYALTQFSALDKQTVSKRMFGFLEIMWAIIADVDLESEHLRFAGSSRFTLMAIVRILNLRKYFGKLHFHKGTPCEKDAKPSVDRRFDSITPASIPSDWTSLNTNFAYFMAMNTPWCSHDFLPAPSARFSDGCLDLVWIEDGNISKMLRVLLDTESGTYVKEKYVRSEKVDAFMLEPDTSQPFGILDIDGEAIPYGPILVETMPHAATLIVPRSHDENVWQR